MKKNYLKSLAVLIALLCLPAALQAQTYDDPGYVFKDGNLTYFIRDANNVMLTYCEDPGSVINIPETATHPYSGKTFTVNAICVGQVKFTDATTYTTTPFEWSTSGNPRAYRVSGPFQGLEVTEIHFPKTIVDVLGPPYWMPSLNIVNVQSIMCNLLEGTRNAVAITIDADNPRLEAADGVVYDKVEKTLVLYPTNLTATTYEVKAGTTKIADYAFDRSFSNSTDHLEKVILPSTITEIGKTAFLSNRHLVDINLPEGLTTIGEYAFRYTSSLSSIDFPSTLTDIGRYGFENSGLTSVNVPGSVNQIRERCFAQNYFMESATLNSGTQYIDQQAFCGNIEMTSILLPEGLRTIGNGSIAVCSKLPSIKIPSTVTKIDNYAFSYNSKMTTINIPAAAKLEKGVFTCCPSLENITVDGGTRYQMDNDGGKLDKGVLYGNSNNVAGTMDELVFFIPKNNIGASNTKLIKQWIVPNHVRTICAGSLGEHNIESLVLPSELTTIEELAFYRDYISSLASELALDEAYKLKELTIPAKVSYLHFSAFYQPSRNAYNNSPTSKCSYIEKIYFMGKPTKLATTTISPIPSPYAGDNGFIGYSDYAYEQPGDFLTAYVKESQYSDWTSTEKGIFNGRVSSEIPLERMTAEGKVASMCRDFDVDFSNATGMKAYIATGYDATNKGVVMQEVKYVPSRTGADNDEYHGIIVRQTAATAGTYRIGENDYNSGSQTTNFVGASNNSVAASQNRLVGVVANSHVQGTDNGVNNWGLSGGKWLRIENTGRLTPYDRSYFQPTAADNDAMLAAVGALSGNEAKVSMLFMDDLEVTGITNTVDNSQLATDSDYYTLDGRRLQGKPTQKGIYIHNGKKEIVK